MNQELFSKLINSLNCRLDKNGNHLKMSSVIVSDGKNIFSHNFGEREKIDIRSISKPILCLAVGVAINEGLYFDGDKISLDTKVYKFLRRLVNFDTGEQETEWQKVALIDLFRITLGHDKGIVFSSDVKQVGEENLLDYVVNYPITHEIGKHFVYSNAGGFLMSVLISEFYGMSADQFVDKYLFSKIGIYDYTWRKYGKYCAGCTGLMMYNEDLHKIAQLISNNGYYNENSIVPEKWICEMRTPHVSSPTHRYISNRAFPKWSYGLNLWITEDGNYYCDGTDGQYIIIIPKRNIVISSTAHQSDTAPISDCFGILK